MKYPIVIGITSLILIIGLISIFTPENKENKAALLVEEVEAIVHLSPTCGCCDIFGTYLDRQGYSVEKHLTDNLEEIKHNLNIPTELYSCHTTEVGGYIVEGHIPEEAIFKLLSEQPDIKGIGMAGMPAGSPGMGGVKRSDFVIYEITHDGKKGDVFLTI